MNKSTPIAQLPNSLPNGGFVNEQQRQFITQAQQAISSNTHLPQNTQPSSDVANDDDLVVQDILNQINATVGAPQVDNQQPTFTQQPLQMPQVLNQSQQPHQQGSVPNPVQQLYQLAQSQSNYDGSPLLFAQQQQLQHQFPLMDYFVNITDDLKLAGLVFFVVIVAHFVRIEDYVARYVAVDKIPYHQIILRAILAALLVLIVKKLLKL
jgi:hypothetical protein